MTTRASFTSSGPPPLASFRVETTHPPSIGSFNLQNNTPFSLHVTFEALAKNGPDSELMIPEVVSSKSRVWTFLPQKPKPDVYRGRYTIEDPNSLPQNLLGFFTHHNTPHMHLEISIHDDNRRALSKAAVCLNVTRPHTDVKLTVNVTKFWNIAFSRQAPCCCFPTFQTRYTLEVTSDLPSQETLCSALVTANLE